MSDFTRKRKRMSYAASFKLKAVEAAEKTSNVEAAKNFGWMRAILEDGERIVHWDPSPIQNVQKEGPKMDNSLKWKRTFLSGLRFKGRMATLCLDWPCVCKHYRWPNLVNIKAPPLSLLPRVGVQGF